MGRGQYDRAAAKAKREAPAEQFVRPAWPYLNAAGSIVNPHGQPITQADYDALVTKCDRLLRLCQTHGLMIDG